MGAIESEMLDVIDRLHERNEMLRGENAELRADIRQSSEVLYEAQRTIERLEAQLQVHKGVEWFDSRREDERI